MLKSYLPWIAALITVLMVIAFALNNGTVVALWFFGFRTYPRLVWVIVGSFLAGAAVGGGLSLRRQFALAAKLREAEQGREPLAAAVALPETNAMLPPADAVAGDEPKAAVGP